MRAYVYTLRVILYFVSCTVWITGIVLSKGFFSCLFAIFILPWCYYLVIEKILQAIGWI